ncbi:Protein SOSEKI 4, partial [Linum perenne]
MCARGNCNASRSYKSEFVWLDLAEDDFIYPAHGSEYVLKGSELLEPSPPLESAEDSFRSLKVPAEIHGHKPSSSTSSDDEYKVYKAEPFSQSSRRQVADVATQTNDKRRRRRAAKLEEEEEEEGEIMEELRRLERESREEIEIGISPPPSDSSPETLETLMKVDRRLIMKSGGAGRESENLRHSRKPADPANSIFQ